MKHLIEITLISLILLGLAFCFGCKEKAVIEKPSAGSQPNPNHNLSEGLEVYELFNEKPEPNEPEYKHERIYGISQGYSGGSTVCAVCGETLKTYEIGDPDAILHYHEPKPEPIIYYIGETEFPLDINKLIPTWPEYIELEKDLVITWPKEILEIGWDYQPQIYMSKGTKIYFKEDE